MNFFIDAYDFILTSIYQIIGTVALFDCAFYALLILFVIKKMGGKKFLFWKLRFFNPPTGKERGPFRNKKFRFFADLVFVSYLIFFAVKLPVYAKFFNPLSESYVDVHTDSAYFIERDRKLIRTGELGLILMPYVWMPVVIVTNKFRQWVGDETRVTWKYHDKRRECIWSGYEDSSCGYAMTMARALHRDDESLSIGKKYVKARKKICQQRQVRRI